MMDEDVGRLDVTMKQLGILMEVLQSACELTHHVLAELRTDRHFVAMEEKQSVIHVRTSGDDEATPPPIFATKSRRVPSEQYSNGMISWIAGLLTMKGLCISTAFRYL